MEVKVALCLFFVFVFNISSLFANEENSNFQEGVLLVKEKKAYIGEFSHFGDGVYLRQKEQGKLFLNTEIEGVVTKEYFNRIKGSSPKESAIESLLNFDSSTNYQWYKNNADYSEDQNIRIIKIVLLITTIYFFHDAYRANQAVKDSDYGFNEGVVNRFERKNQQYQIAASLTAAFYLFTTCKAYLRFGRDSQFNDLQIKDRSPGYLKEESIQSNLMNHQIQLEAHISF